VSVHLDVIDTVMGEFAHACAECVGPICDQARLHRPEFERIVCVSGSRGVQDRPGGQKARALYQPPDGKAPMRPWRLRASVSTARSRCHGRRQDPVGFPILALRHAHHRFHPRHVGAVAIESLIAERETLDIPISAITSRLQSGRWSREQRRCIIGFLAAIPST
jgi:hypothetical protein